MRNILIVLVMVGLALISGCTDNQRAKQFGGTMTIDLTPGLRLVNLTWKEANLWVLTRNADPGEKTHTYTFREDSNFGILQGKIVVTER